MVTRKRSIAISGHRTSFSLEDEFFEAIAYLADRESISLAALVSRIDMERSRDSNLSSALRLYVLEAAKLGKLGQA